MGGFSRSPNGELSTSGTKTKSILEEKNCEKMQGGVRTGGRGAVLLVSDLDKESGGS